MRHIRILKERSRFSLDPLNLKLDTRNLRPEAQTSIAFYNTHFIKYLLSGCDIFPFLVLISMRKELESRLVIFASNIIKLKQYIKQNFEGEHLTKQLIRSGTSAALNFGEALGTVSKRDFIHKQSIVLKELRETHINLQIIECNNLCSNIPLQNSILDECDQLIRLFTKSLQTLLKNKK